MARISMIWPGWKKKKKYSISCNINRPEERNLEIYYSKDMHILLVIITYLRHFLPWQPKVCICDKLFPANWLSACHDDNRKSCALNAERLSCPARNVYHLMTSDVNKWLVVTQNLRHSSSVLIVTQNLRHSSSVHTFFFYFKRVEIVKWNMW